MDHDKDAIGFLLIVAAAMAVAFAALLFIVALAIGYWTKADEYEPPIPTHRAEIAMQRAETETTSARRYSSAPAGAALASSHVWQQE